jgi:hypothetical protein
MSASALTYPIGPLTPPSARLPSEAIGSQVAHQISSTTSDGASAVTPPGNPLINALGVASESVTITLSATAQQAIARQQQALDQLRQVNEQLRTSNHDAAAARLQHLLQEFHALQQFGTASARALAALAKEISAAAADLSAGGGNGALRRPTHRSPAQGTKRLTVPPTPRGTKDQPLRQARPPQSPAQMRHKWRQGQRLRRRKARRPTLRLPKGNTPPHPAHKLRTRALQPPRLVLLIRERSRQVLPNDRRCSIISKTKQARMPRRLKQRRPIETC